MSSYKHGIIRLRRGTAAEWAAGEPQPGGEVLRLGEPGYEKDTGKLKIGDGSTPWNSLAYFNAGATIDPEDIEDIIGNGFLIAGTGINISYNDGGDSLTISTSGVSLQDHNHVSSDITDFNSSVSGLLPIKNIIAGTNVSISSVSGIYTISADDPTANEANSLITTVFNKTGSPIPKFSVVYISGGQGDQPTIALASASGEMTSSKTYGVTAETISNMSTGKVIVYGALTGVDTDQFNPTAPTGDVNGVTLYLSPVVAGGVTTSKPSAPNHMVSVGTIVRTHQNEGIVEIRIQNGFELEELHNVAISGVTSGQFLQYNGSGLWVPSNSGNFTNLSVNGTSVSLNGHTHLASDITNFNSSVSGLLPTIANSGNNRILTSDGTSIGINAESALTFDDSTGRLLTYGGYILVQDLSNKLDPAPDSGKNTSIGTYIEPSGFLGSPSGTHNILGFSSNVSPRSATSNYNMNYYGGANAVYLEIPSGVANSGAIIGGNFSAWRNARGANVGSNWIDDNGTLSRLQGCVINYGHAMGQSGVLGPAPTGVSPYTNTAYGLIIAPQRGYGTINTMYDIFVAQDNYQVGTINTHYGIYQQSNNPNYFAGSISMDNGLSAPTKIYNLGAVSGNTSISYGIDKQIQKLTLNGTAVNFIEGAGWDISDKSVDVMLQITATSTTTVAFDSNFVTDWYSTLPTFSSGTYLVLLRSMGTGVVQGHYIGNKL